ncbi:aminotransferase class IV [Candidatus Microgenomates bacterium]|nr:aminotransferase class IV [Candidatus Microgenomates bacterium]
MGVLKRNKYLEGVYIRPLVYVSTESVVKFNLNKLDCGFAIYTVPLGHFFDVANGIKIKVSSWTRVSSGSIPPGAKPTGIYLNTCLAKTEVEDLGFGEAVLLNSDGSISEGSAENIFLVKDGNLVTPSLDQNILEGITRNTIIELAKSEFGIKTIQRKIMANELETADEIFLTGTGAEVTPVNTVGLITKRLQQLYFDVVHGKVNKYSHWLTYAR